MVLRARKPCTPIRTPEGIRARAVALELWLNRWVPEFIASSFEDDAEDHEPLAMSLARRAQEGRGISRPSGQCLDFKR
jgi:hypothetical protein